MKALVIGGNGFIGSHLVDRLVECGWIVSVYDFRERRYDAASPNVRFVRGDLNQTYLLREALVGIDVVYHLAWATVHESSNQNPIADIHLNLIPTIQLMDACREANIRRMVFISSGGTVYGEAQSSPIAETHPQNPLNVYGIHKLTVEKYLYLYRHLHNLDYVVIRPSVPFGPRQNPLGKQGVVSVFLYRIGRRLPITIWGDGSVSRDYFYISDLVEAAIAAGTQVLGENRIFNIGGGKHISLIQLIETIEGIVGEKAQVDFQPPRKFDAPHISMDTQLARRYLGWQPVIPLAQGISQTWTWISSIL